MSIRKRKERLETSSYYNADLVSHQEREEDIQLQLRWDAYWDDMRVVGPIETQHVTEDSGSSTKALAGAKVVDLGQIWSLIGRSGEYSAKEIATRDQLFALIDDYLKEFLRPDELEPHEQEERLDIIEMTLQAVNELYFMTIADTKDDWESFEKGTLSLQKWINNHRWVPVAPNNVKEVT